MNVRLLAVLIFVVNGPFSRQLYADSTLPLEIAGVTVTPHVQASGMRYRQAPDPSLGARVQLFVRNAGSAELRLPGSLVTRFRGMQPDELVKTAAWCWFDTPAAWRDNDLRLPAGAMTVWQFNTRDANWGVGTEFDLDVQFDEQQVQRFESLPIADPQIWISAATFLGHCGNVQPDQLVLYVANHSTAPIHVEACRLWLPADRKTWRSLVPGTLVPIQQSFPSDGTIAAGEKGGATVDFGLLPLTYTAIEVLCTDEAGKQFSLWAHLRIKREAFDISGGWVNSSLGSRTALQCEPFLKTLKRLHINTAHIAETPGYTDQNGPEGLYTRYPLKYFNRLEPIEHYESDAVLPRVHAVEFLGEPQYGGGKPVPPMEVWTSLAPYQATRLPTSVTHSEERIWRYYAGLSDYPHYDAYRVSAPSPDAWHKYDRWGGKKILWGAPLETIGEMSRSLRELNRPAPTAYWSQGPHHGWGPMWGRKRASPTPDELRLQAYHALANRITSLYWFNLSLPSLIKYRDTLNELTRVGREIRMLEQYFLEGDAYQHRRMVRDGQPDWDLASIAGPRGAVLFALDLAYAPGSTTHVFEFRPPRAAKFGFSLPAWCQSPAEVFRVDADGTHDVAYKNVAGGIELSDTVNKVAIYVVSPQSGQRAALEVLNEELNHEEQQVGFDPAHNDDDFKELQELAHRLPED